MEVKKALNKDGLGFSSIFGSSCCLGVSFFSGLNTPAKRSDLFKFAEKRFELNNPELFWKRLFEPSNKPPLFLLASTENKETFSFGSISCFSSGLGMMLLLKRFEKRPNFAGSFCSSLLIVCETSDLVNWDEGLYSKAVPFCSWETSSGVANLFKKLTWIGAFASSPLNKIKVLKNGILLTLKGGTTVSSSDLRWNFPVLWAFFCFSARMSLGNLIFTIL